MATQTLSRAPPIGNDKTRSSQADDNFSPRKPTQSSPVYIPPNEFRMKLLKRILSVDGTIDNKALHKLQKSSSERTLQANILFQNGDVGTLISFDRLNDETEKKDDEKEETEQGLPSLKPEETEKQDRTKDGVKRERPLKLPPIMLPPVYTLTPRPLVFRDYSGPPYIPPPTRDEDWEDLEDCRYLRPAKKQFKTSNDYKSFLLANGASR